MGNFDFSVAVTEDKRDFSRTANSQKGSSIFQLVLPMNFGAYFGGVCSAPVETDHYYSGAPRHGNAWHW